MQRLPSSLHPVQASSLEILRARFSGQAAAAPERQTTTNAWQVRSEVVQTDGLMPFQILTKGKKPQHPCSDTPAQASSIEGDVGAAVTSPAEVDPHNVPLPAEDEDEGSWEDVELPEVLMANHTDGTEGITSVDAIADIDYAPTTEIDIKSSISEEKVKAATALYRIWRRLKVHRNDTSAALTPLMTSQQDLIVIARGLASSSAAYRYALVSYVPHYLVGLGCIINETKKVKEKVSCCTAAGRLRHGLTDCSFCLAVEEIQKREN